MFSHKYFKHVYSAIFCRPCHLDAVSPAHPLTRIGAASNTPDHVRYQCPILADFLPQFHMPHIKLNKFLQRRRKMNLLGPSCLFRFSTFHNLLILFALISTCTVANSAKFRSISLPLPPVFFSVAIVFALPKVNNKLKL